MFLAQSQCDFSVLFEKVLILEKGKKQAKKMNEPQKLTKTKKILPQEWIQDYFNPVIGVLSTPEVNGLCHKNNLSMVEMLEPFARLTTDVTVKDPEGINHAISNLSLTFQDFHKDPSRNIGPRLLSDTVGSITEEPLVSRAFPTRSLQLEAPGKFFRQMTAG